jgi:hypothetical protein
MPKFKKSDGFHMKRGSKPTFKDLGSSSPAKVNWEAMGDKVVGNAGLIGARMGGPMGYVAGKAIQRRLDGTAASEKKFEDVLESEGLKRNFWGKLGFGGKRSRERKQRIKELEAQEQEGIDRDRIAANTGAPVAGPGA